MAEQKDHMRNRILEAERIWAAAGPSRFHRPTELESFGNRIVRKVPFQKRLEHRTLHSVSVRESDMCVPRIDTSNGERWTIYVPSSATRLNVLHAMAHGMMNVGIHSGQGLPSGAIHGPDFVKVYLDLIQRFVAARVDKDTRNEFKQLLLDHKVKTSTRTLSPEALEAARARMADVREPNYAEGLQEMLADLEDLRRD